MSVVSNRSQTFRFTGDVDWTQVISAAQNSSASAVNELINLSSGFNSLTIPKGGSTQPTAVTIIPPAANTVALTLKGVTGDTGIPIHLTDPTTIAIPSSSTTIGITAASTCNGVRLIWS